MDMPGLAHNKTVLCNVILVELYTGLSSKSIKEKKRDINELLKDHKNPGPK